jgi:hypothetical protein
MIYALPANPRNRRAIIIGGSIAIGDYDFH